MRLAANYDSPASRCNRAGTQSALLLIAVCGIALPTALIQPAPFDIRIVGVVEPPDIYSTRPGKTACSRIARESRPSSECDAIGAVLVAATSHQDWCARDPACGQFLRALPRSEYVMTASWILRINTTSRPPAAEAYSGQESSVSDEDVIQAYIARLVSRVSSEMTSNDSAIAALKDRRNCTNQHRLGVFRDARPGIQLDQELILEFCVLRSRNPCLSPPNPV